MGDLWPSQFGGKKAVVIIFSKIQQFRVKREWILWVIYFPKMYTFTDVTLTLKKGYSPKH